MVFAAGKIDQVGNLRSVVEVKVVDEGDPDDRVREDEQKIDLDQRSKLFEMILKIKIKDNVSYNPARSRSCV